MDCATLIVWLSWRATSIVLCCSRSLLAMSLSAEELAEMTKDFEFPDGLTAEQVAERLAPYEDFSKDITACFKALGLDEYTAAFVDEGYDDAHFLRTLEADELDEIIADAGMKRGHILKLKTWLAKEIRIISPTEYVVVHRYSGQVCKAVPEEAYKEMMAAAAEQAPAA